VPENFDAELAQLLASDGGWEPGEENWVFGYLWDGVFHARSTLACSIRRRRWVRQRRFRPEVLRLRDDLRPPSRADANETVEAGVHSSLAFASHLGALEAVSEASGKQRS
jgi:hypothetical protein